MSEAKQSDSNLKELLKIAEGNTVNEYLETLKNLARPAQGFSIKAGLKMSSNVCGIGVFAAEFLSAGKRIDTDRVLTAFTREQAYAFLEAVPNNELRRWWLEHIYCLDDLMKIDMIELDTMMLNHSDNPSIVTREDGYDYTTRDVAIDEELTEDYRTYDTVQYYDELCKKYGVEDFSDKWKQEISCHFYSSDMYKLLLALAHYPAFPGLPAHLL